MSGPWADWDRPFDPDNPLLIDAEEYPRMADATREARSWFRQSGMEDMRTGRPRKITMNLCDVHEIGQCVEGDPCRVMRDVWAYGGPDS